MFPVTSNVDELPPETIGTSIPDCSIRRLVSIKDRIAATVPREYARTLDLRRFPPAD